MEKLFVFLKAETNDVMNRSLSINQRDNEELDYLLMMTGQRLMASRDAQSVSIIFLDFMQSINVESAYLALVPKNNRINDKLFELRVTAYLQKGKIYQVSKNEVDKLSNIHELLKFNLEFLDNNLLILPIGIDHNFLGLCVVDISIINKNWHLCRSIQAYLSQALITLEQIEIKQESEQDAKRANLAKTDFLSRMTHELRTPMNGVIAMTNLLLDSPLDNEQEEFVNTIKNSGNTLMKLINEILDFSKIEADKIKLEYTDFNFRDCIEEALDLVIPFAAKKNLYFNYFIENDIPDNVYQDETRIRQVVTNLLSNAVKFTERGEIYLHACMYNDFLEVSVQDTGIGIKNEQTKKLFQPFSQVSTDIHRKYGGTGLGLVISKKICEFMGGNLVFDGSYEAGARFKFSIPIKTKNKYFAKKSWQLLLDEIRNCEKTFISVSRSQQCNTMLSQILQGKNRLHFVNYYQLEQKINDFLTKNSLDDLVILLDIHPDYPSDLVDFEKINNNWPKLKSIVITNRGALLNHTNNANLLKVIYRPIKPKNLCYALANLWHLDTEKYDRMVTSQIDRNFAEKYPLKILLVEDNLVNQKVAKSLLSRCGYKIDIAGDGVEALSLLKQRFYEVVLMDVFMPNMDGETATKIIRSTFPTSKQPYIIATTANTQTGDREKLINLGMDDYISKPIIVKDLLSALANAKHEFH